MSVKTAKIEKIIPAEGKSVENDQIPLIFRFKSGKTGKRKAIASLKIAESDQERAVGLSKTASLGPLSGMFFTKAGSFWMPPSMKFPLDLVFIDKRGKILEKKAMPLDNGRGRYYTYEPTAEHAIELPLGFCDKHKISSGDLVEVVGPISH